MTLCHLIINKVVVDVLHMRKKDLIDAQVGVTNNVTKQCRNNGKKLTKLTKKRVNPS